MHPASRATLDAIIDEVSRVVIKATVCVSDQMKQYIVSWARAARQLERYAGVPDRYNMRVENALSRGAPVEDRRT